MKYYKITNKEENHKGMQYNDGLNEDILPFHPRGDCLSGGIYFSREDILAFLDYGIFIREVTLPEGEEIYKNPGEPKKWKSHRVILGERRKINLEIIKELVKKGANIKQYGIEALKYAAIRGHLEIVEYIIGCDININDTDSLLVQLAARNGHLDVVKYLIGQGADVHAGDDCALKYASNNGHLEVVKFLVGQGANIHAGCDSSLGYASESGHLDVVKYLKSVMEKENEI